VGSACPDCAACNTKGTLRHDTDSLQSIVRLVGSPLITGTRFLAPGMRCDTCQTRFQTPVPEEIKNVPKYDVSCATTLAIGRYSLGLPMYRMEQTQAQHGIPMKDATQWDLLHGLYDTASPVYGALGKYASNGSLMLYDDTPGRILENQALGGTTHTTAFISVHEGNKIHLFFTGTNHAGNNADAILANRTTDESVIAMMDASPSNIPKKMNAELTARFILCFCLVHGRRKFFEMLGAFDKECDFVLDVIGQVFANDTHCKENKLSPEARLIYHQTHSQPLMDTLQVWLHNQLAYELSEPNSGLGEAVRYMLRHWIPLTTFLRVAGAPLDSSWAERAIKIAIRHRRNSLFYKTPKGAQVGDCLMSIIYTCTRNGINPYDYLNTLQRHGPEVKANPDLWLPWNYLQTMITIPMAKAA
jgi:transposase